MEIPLDPSPSRSLRALLVLSTLVVAVGLVFTIAQVVDGVADREVVYHGDIDANEVLRQFHPSRADGTSPPNNAGYLSQAEGDMTFPNANESALTLWVIQALAPWIFGALVLFWLAPILRAARDGDPFLASAANRLRRIGILLLVGLPLLSFVQFAGATAAQKYWISPTVDFKWTIDLWQLLPGLAVLVLAEVFRHGYALADLERHTV
jgi:hypothetical protein